MILRAAILLSVTLSMTAHATGPDVFDGRWQLGNQHSVVTELQGGAKASQAGRLAGGDALFLKYAFKSRKWYANARYGRVDDTVRTGLELNRQVGSGRSEFELGRSWNGHGGDWWKKQTLRTIYEFSQNNDGQLLADRYLTEFGIIAVNQAKVQVQYQSGREIQAGQIVDFDRYVFTGSIQPLDGLELGVKTHIGMNSKEGQEIVDANVIDAQLTWQFDPRGSVRLSVRQKDIERNPDAYMQNVEEHLKDTGSELRYSWKLNPQTEFNLGYSDAYDEIYAIRQLDSNWFMQVGYTRAF